MVRDRRTYLAGSVFLLLVAVDLAVGLGATPAARAALGPLAVLSLAVAVLRVRGTAVWTALGILSLGLGIAAAEGSWATWYDGIAALVPVLGLITFAQLMARPIERGGYQAELIRSLERRCRWPGARQHVAVVATFLLGCLTTAGALPASYRVLVRSGDDRSTRDALLRSAMRGAGAAIGLTPATGAFGITMAVTGLAAPALVALAAPAALAVLSLALLAAPRYAARSEPALAAPPGAGRLRDLVLALVAVAGIVLGLGRSDTIGPLHAIVLSLIIVATAWSLLLDLRSARRQLRSFPLQVANAAPSFALFVAAGGLAAVIASGTWLGTLREALLLTSSVLPPWLAIAGAIWLLFHLGLHPAVAIGIVAPAALGARMVSPSMMASLSLAAAGTGVISSPFGGLASIASGLSRRSIVEVGFGWQLGFSLTALVVAGLLAQILRL